ncbi:MarR family winged helix-turn-helix transcriptional regulator [Luteipulveratus flavus]|uniref:MarR family transcriptional regulator n=1 Tax=Luteipulveratus flavus TaxID=3031728 RepID=A0ABT6C7Y0_9MICO|nr:MarR family transcriptional regulator [Luteipulveratus sp. YIM 133296]MDF8264975.1 MarR family transcriptional regulator [Luteipulveratus sp. YIM 133296]
MSQPAPTPSAESSRLLFNVFLIEQQVGAVLARALEDIGVTPSEFAIYAALEMHGEPITPSDLAARINVPRSTLTGYLGALDRRGHLERLPNPADGRSAYVRLTDTGRRTQSTAAAAALQVQADLDRRLGPALEDVRQALVTLHEGLDAVLRDDRGTPSPAR